jgi:hypothetical protein
MDVRDGVQIFQVEVIHNYSDVSHDAGQAATAEEEVVKTPRSLVDACGDAGEMCVAASPLVGARDPNLTNGRCAHLAQKSQAEAKAFDVQHGEGAQDGGVFERGNLLNVHHAWQDKDAQVFELQRVLQDAHELQQRHDLAGMTRVQRAEGLPWQRHLYLAGPQGQALCGETVRDAAPSSAGAISDSPPGRRRGV